jgi:hypothetical protein
MGWVFLNGTVLTYRGIFGIEPNIMVSTTTDGVTLSVGSTTVDLTGVGVLPVSTWVHLAVVVRQITTASHIFFVYVNGELQASGANTTITWVTFTKIVLLNTIRPGTYTGPLNGFLQDVRIWRRTLNQMEVWREMHTRPPNRMGLLAWYPIWWDTQTPVQDKSGLGRTLAAGAGVLNLGGGPSPPPFELRPLILPR